MLGWLWKWFFIVNKLSCHERHVSRWAWPYWPWWQCIAMWHWTDRCSANIHCHHCTDRVKQVFVTLSVLVLRQWIIVPASGGVEMLRIQNLPLLFGRSFCSIMTVPERCVELNRRMRTTNELVSIKPKYNPPVFALYVSYVHVQAPCKQCYGQAAALLLVDNIYHGLGIKYFLITVHKKWSSWSMSDNYLIILGNKDLIPMRSHGIKVWSLRDLLHIEKYLLFKCWNCFPSSLSCQIGLHF